jgi:hypothetical protein
VRVVLALPEDAAVDPRRMSVRFQNPDSRFRSPARLEQVAGRTRVEVSVPHDRVADGLWHLKLREGGSMRDLGARLLVHGDQPVALLFGKTPNIN